MTKAAHSKRIANRGEADSAADAAPADEGLRQQIARLAYSFWESRGYQGGSPEADWFRAEAEIRRQLAEGGQPAVQPESPAPRVPAARAARAR